ncbi:hypothetical protein WISP_20275 [Willisornis vidua]|uniref:Bactericidal permeability-increasing protein n=1 Tax=Willisornis vidua TaxID=1566151 RepID=A0ABQ9DN70_9PASS|nr:hypothetical protein WISP_20275 [Willisornis vidua]
MYLQTDPCDKGEKMLKTWYFFLLSWLSLRLEANPGLKVRITQKGLDYGRRIGMELVKQAVLKETFPTWSGQESLAVVKVNYVISRLRINAVDFPETSASFIPGTGVCLSVAEASATISADWRISAWLLKGEGEITVSISGLFISVTFRVSRDSTGHLSTALHSCQLSIDSVKVKLGGRPRWIYSFLSGYLEKPIHTELDKNICLNIKHKIQMMDAQLRKHKLLSQIDAFAQVDYSLVSSPAVFKSHINLDLKGTVYPVGNRTDPPFVPAPFALPDQGDSMIYLGVSNYFLKSASLAYYKAGAFNITISEELATTFSLNTSLLKYFVSETASTRANLTIMKQRLIISLLLKRFQFSLMHSSLGFPEQKSVVENFLSYALRRVVIPVINDKLGKGFPLLNLAHTSLTGPLIKMNQGLAMGFNPQSTVPEYIYLKFKLLNCLNIVMDCSYALRRLPLKISQLLWASALQGNFPQILPSSLLSGQLSGNPGLKVRITQKGLEYAKEVGLEILKQNMEKEHFPDLTGHEKFGLGNVNYNISGRDSGRSTVHISKVFVTAIFSTSLDNTGSTSISLTNCQTTSGDIDIKLNGKSGFLHNFFIKYLKKPIRRSLVTNSCPNIRAGIQLIDEDLQSLNVVMPIDDLAEVDYSLNSLPAVFQPFIDLDLKGAVFPAGIYTGSPFVAAPFSIPDQSDSMLYLAFSEYFFQTSSFAYYTAGAFNMTIAEEVSGTQRNGVRVAQVAKYSVTPYPVMLKLMATEIPAISLEQDSFTVEIQGSMEVLAVLPDSTTQLLFTMNTTANSSISLNIFDQKLMGSLCLNRLQFSLAHSNVGFFEVSLLENILSYILQTEVIPSANAKLSKGLPLPNLANVTLTRPHITIVQVRF